MTDRCAEIAARLKKLATYVPNHYGPSPVAVIALDDALDEIAKAEAAADALRQTVREWQKATLAYRGCVCASDACSHPEDATAAENALLALQVEQD